MSKRLRIAKKLLSDRGVIFISIDDNEQANLKLLCDEIFGAEKFLGTITRRQSSGAKNDTGDNRIVATADYILVFAKQEFNFTPIYALNTKKYSKSDSQGCFSARALEMQGGGDTLKVRPKMGYSIYFRESDGDVKLLFDYNLENVPVYLEPNTELLSEGYRCYRPRMRDKEHGIWRWGDTTFIEKFKNNLVHFENGRVFIKEREKEFVPKFPEAIWDDFLNTQGTNELKVLFGEKTFSFPKPTSLIQRILNITNSKVVLDFFAGSGTTLHATMQLNAEDGGKRTCILCTNNENGICENVTYERNKRVINGYTKPNGEEVEGLHDNNLRYYRTEFISRERSVKNMRLLVSLSTELLCIKEDLYAEQKQFAGQQTYKGVFRFFDDGKKQMLVIYREEVIAELVPLIASTEYSTPIKVYVFSPSEDPWEADFEDVVDKVELCALPQAIYNAYKRVLPKPNDRNIAAPEPEAELSQENFGGLFNFTEEGGDQ